MPPELKAADILAAERIIGEALAEDLGGDGDITSAAVIPEDARFAGVMRAREELVLAGLPLAALVFDRLSEEIAFTPLADDGDEVVAGAELARIDGPAGALLSAERVALNLLQRLSGIATLTRRYVRAIEGTGATLLDTRKTTPGWRHLEKYATRAGGAENHRMGLYDAILIKDNHIAVVGSVAAAVERARAAGHVSIEVECDTLAQVKEAVTAGATRILLDNMSPEELSACVREIAGRAETEASGGVTLANIRAVAASGVDYVSTSAITLSAPAVDIGLDWRLANA